MPVEGKDRDDLRRAVEILEAPSFIMRLTEYLGQPIEKAIDFLPRAATGKIHGIVNATLAKLLATAIRTIDSERTGPASTVTHKIATGVSGAVGGAFGLPALALELPLSTAIILRSIADIARSEGENIRALDSRLACLEVFALGGRPETDDGSETGYYAVRAALAKAVSDAVKFIAEKGVAPKSAPVIVRLIALLASRFGAVVTEKMAAQAIPVIGALGGAAVNLLFVDHFQDVARGHFIIRRLERVHGREEIRQAYEAIRDHKQSSNPLPEEGPW